MGLQLIICVETNKKCNSDYIYIKTSIEHFYSINQGNIKLSPVYFNGKGNYSSKKAINDINKLSKQYSASSEENKSIVLCCFDCDDYDSKPEDMVFLNGAKSFCDQNGFRFIWFCKDIEQVYLGKSIPDSSKKKEAESFLRKKKIKDVRINNLKVARYQNGKSNLCAVLDEYLIRQ
jgi:hypothetical protein